MKTALVINALKMSLGSGYHPRLASDESTDPHGFVDTISLYNGCQCCMSSSIFGVCGMKK